MASTVGLGIQLGAEQPRSAASFMRRTVDLSIPRETFFFFKSHTGSEMIAHNRRHSYCFSGASLICLISLVLNNYSFLCLPLTRCLPAVYVLPANCAVFVWLIPPRCHQIKVSRSINCLSTTIRILLPVLFEILSMYLVFGVIFVIDSSVNHVQGYSFLSINPDCMKACKKYLSLHNTSKNAKNCDARPLKNHRRRPRGRRRSDCELVNNGCC